MCNIRGDIGGDLLACESIYSGVARWVGHSAVDRRSVLTNLAMALEVSENLRAVRSLQVSTLDEYCWISAAVWGQYVNADTFAPHERGPYSGELMLAIEDDSLVKNYRHSDPHAHSRLLLAAKMNSSKGDLEYIEFARGYRAIVELLDRAAISFVSYAMGGRYHFLLALERSPTQRRDAAWDNIYLWHRTRSVVNSRVNSRDTGDGPAIRIAGQQLYNLAGSVNYLACSPLEYRGSNNEVIDIAARTANRNRLVPPPAYASPIKKTLPHHKMMDDSPPPNKISNGWGECDAPDSPPALKIALPEL